MKCPTDEHRIKQLRERGKILDGEVGRRFYHRALKPKARARKRSKRKQAKKSRGRNRR